MTNLVLTNKNFQGNEKWPLLFVIAEIIINYSFDSSPLTNIEVTRICKEKYGLTVERRTVGFYKTILEKHFGFKFKVKGKGYYLSYRPLPFDKEKCFEGVEYRNSNLFDTIRKNIEICKKAINNEKCINFTCKDYIFGTLEIKDKKIKLIPIRIICIDKNYFLFSYSIAFNEFFYVNLLKNKIEIGTNQSIDKYQKKKLFEFKNYFNNEIVTGRRGILNKLTSELEKSDRIVLTKTNHFLKESLISLYEKYGEDNVYYEYEGTDKIVIQVYSEVY